MSRISSLHAKLVATAILLMAACDSDAGDFVAFQNGDSAPSTKKSPAIPLYISQKTYGAEGAPSSIDFVRAAHDVWGFDGVELSAGTVLHEAGGPAKLLEWAAKFRDGIKEFGVPGTGDHSFALHLSINTGDQFTVPAVNAKATDPEILTASVDLLKTIPFKSCSLVFQKSGDKITDGEIQLWTSKLNAACPETRILIENFPTWTSVGLDQFLSVVKTATSKPGCLIRTDNIHYRLDLAIQDVWARTDQVPDAIRIQCVTADASTSEAALYDREVVRRAITEQVAARGTSGHPLFISFESSSALRWNASQKKNTTQVGLGSKTMRDLILAVKNGLVN